MQAFQAALTPSPWLRGGSVLLHITAMAAASVYFDGWRVVALCLLLALSAAWAWHGQSGRHRTALRRIDIDAQGRATVFDRHHIAYEAVLCSGSLVGRYLLVLHWHAGGRAFYHAISADMTDKEAFRRLKVWARWAQDAQKAA